MLILLRICDVHDDIYSAHNILYARNLYLYYGMRVRYINVLPTQPHTNDCTDDHIKVISLWP